jgi:cyclic pyranopterin phosphate synthase
MRPLSHLDDQGSVRMVDVTSKENSRRTAVAQADIQMQAETLSRILRGSVSKGNVFETARIAGIMAAKRTASLIPMCHPLNITHAAIDFFPDDRRARLRIEATVSIVGPTGVEMEALTAAVVAALTIYDMCKSADRRMVIGDVHLLEKSGGRSGHFKFPAGSAT